MRAGVNQTATELARLRQETTADAERVLTLAFWLGLLLGLIVLAAPVQVALIYRALARRLEQKRPPPGESSVRSSVAK